MTQDNTETTLARLVYLIIQHRVEIPRGLQSYLPWGEWLAKLHRGAGSTEASLEQVKYLIEQGSALGPGTRDEAVNLISGLVDANLVSQRLEWSKRVEIYGLLKTLDNAEMIESGMRCLADPPSGEDLPSKWYSGFAPIDIATGGLYPGLLVVMGKPGMGKTSIMLSMMEAVVQNNMADSVLFVENEIPLAMMDYKLQPVYDRTVFRGGDILICASWSAENVEEWVLSNPDPNRVVFFDGPDVTAQARFTERRFNLEAAYQTLIRLKRICKLVVCSSQPRRGDGGLTMESVAESWAKAWYADMIVGIEQDATPGVLSLRTLKNRFGPNDKSVPFSYRYSDLSWEVSSVDADPNSPW